MEAEKLRVAEYKGCPGHVQAMDAARWSNGNHMLFHAGRGGYAVLEVDMPTAGKHKLEIYFTKASDYGIVEVSLDGKRVGKSFDAFNSSLIPSGRIEFGIVQLSEGKHLLRFEVAEKNPSSANYWMGIDCLKFTPVK